jgi:hypothetical protein
MCEVELKAFKSKSVDFTSIKGSCRACLTRLGFLEKVRRGDHQEEFLPMHHPNLFKNVAFDWAKLEISESNEGTTKSSANKTTTHSNMAGTSAPACTDNMTVSDKSDSTPKTTKEGSDLNKNRDCSEQYLH